MKCGLEIFALDLQKKNCPQGIYVNEMGLKVIMLESIPVCYITSYIIHGVSKENFLNE